MENRKLAHSLIWTTSTVCQCAGLYPDPLNETLIREVGLLGTEISLKAFKTCFTQSDGIQQKTDGLRFWPARAWFPAAPTRTPPERSQSHRRRWSSSGIPPISSPSSPQHEAPSPGPEERDARLSHLAPSSSHTGAVGKKKKESQIFFPW